MYLWKFWRDTRRGVFVYLSLLIAFGAFWLSTIHRLRLMEVSADPISLWWMDIGVAFAMSYLCAVVMGFATAAHGVGTDVGRGTGDFLLTRPRSRRYFVWSGWAAGIAELLGLVTLTSVLVLALNVFAVGPFSRHASAASMVVSVDHQVLDVRLMLATVLVSAALVYGLTYFLSILLRSGQRGVVWSLAVLFAYSITASLLKKFTGVSLPTSNFMELGSASTGPWHLTASIQIVWLTLLSIAFPAAAQITLERADI